MSGKDITDMGEEDRHGFDVRTVIIEIIGERRGYKAPLHMLRIEERHHVIGG